MKSICQIDALKFETRTNWRDSSTKMYKIAMNNGWIDECCIHMKPSKNKKINIVEFTQRSIEIHKNKYDYTLVRFNNTSEKVKIKCPKHGIFEQTATNHLKGFGCGKCADEKTSVRQLISEDEFLKRAIDKHGNVYDYSLVKFIGYLSKIKIKCPKHNIFEQKVAVHLNGHGCPFCKESKGEKQIYNYLIENNIEFVRQHKFDGCRHKHKLKFDFFIPKLNTCVDFDGRQHTVAIDYFGGEKSLKYIKLLDSIKTEYCKINNIDLLRINHQQNIILVLSNYINSKMKYIQT